MNGLMMMTTPDADQGAEAPSASAPMVRSSRAHPMVRSTARPTAGAPTSSPQTAGFATGDVITVNDHRCIKIRDRANDLIRR